MNRTALLAMAAVMGLLCMGCAASGKPAPVRGGASDVSTVKTLSVSAFSGAGSAVSRDVQNAVIEVLLQNYSIVVGAEADAVIEGIISMSPDGTISAVSARVLRDSREIDTARVVPSAAGASPEAVGRELGARLKEIISQ